MPFPSSAACACATPRHLILRRLATQAVQRILPPLRPVLPESCQSPVSCVLYPARVPSGSCIHSVGQSDAAHALSLRGCVQRRRRTCSRRRATDNAFTTTSRPETPPCSQLLWMQHTCAKRPVVHTTSADRGSRPRAVLIQARKLSLSYLCPTSLRVLIGLATL
jgi:hypothetical protein